MTKEKLCVPVEEAERRVIIAALVEALYALRKLTEASESVSVYPEGSFGLDYLATAEGKARAILDRFAFEDEA